MTIDQFNKSLKQIIKSNDVLKANSLLVALLKEVEENYQQEILKTYQQVSHGKMEEQDISTFF